MATLKSRIYLVEIGEKLRLVRALNRSQAVAHVVKDSVSVKVATGEDLLEAGRQQMTVEEASKQG